MKKLIKIMVLAVTVLLVGCAHYSPAQVEEFNNVVQSLNTPKRLDKWLLGNFTYDWDLRASNAASLKSYGCGQHLVRTPIEVYYKKGGVCWDCANFACYVLHKHGYNAKTVYGRASSEPGHAVCAYEKDGKWWIIGDTSNLGHEFLEGPVGPFDTMREVAFYAAWGKKADYGKYRNLVDMQVNTYKLGW